MEAQTVATVANQLANITLRSSTPIHNNKPTTTLKISTTTTTYKDSIDSEIDSHLKKLIQIRPPFEVFKPMHHLVFSKPKNIAPALCIAACESVGGRRSDALSAAAAIHLMQVAVSTHENLLIGNVRPKLKYPFHSNIELLTGDGIVPLALELIATTDQNRDECYASRVVRVIAEMTRAIGSRGVVDAQYKKYASTNRLEDEASPHVKQLRLKKLKAKQGAFYGTSAACGAILGGGNDESVEIFRRCGIFVGMMNEERFDGDGMVGDLESVMELRDLAMMELERLDADRIEFISSMIDSVFCDDKWRSRSGRELSAVL